MIIIDDVVQGSDEWNRLRVANPGVSSLDKIITSTGSPSKQRKQYLYKMAGEMLLGEKATSYSDANMKRGTELEPEARAFFELVSGLKVKEVALCYRDELKLFHCSPDGLIVGKKEGLEIKNPLIATHVGYLVKNKLPTEYILQCQGSLAITDYEAWHFFSNYPGLKPLWVRVERDEALIKIILDELSRFCFDLKKLVEKLR